MTGQEKPHDQLICDMEIPHKRELEKGVSDFVYKLTQVWGSPQAVHVQDTPKEAYKALGMEPQHKYIDKSTAKSQTNSRARHERVDPNSIAKSLKTELMRELPPKEGEPELAVWNLLDWLLVKTTTK